MKKVLLVEDDLAFVTLIQLALKDLDFEFHIAREGQSALAHLQKESYDLVIADYRLPRVDGVEILQAAARRNPACKAVLITAADSEELGSRLGDLPLIGLIEKPFSPIEFRRMIISAV